MAVIPANHLGARTDQARRAWLFGLFPSGNEYARLRASMRFRVHMAWLTVALDAGPAR